MADVGAEGAPPRRRRSRPLTAERSHDVDDVVVDVRVPSPEIDVTDGSREPHPAPSRRRILIVDDEPDVRAWLRIALEPLRWDVNAARDGAEAIEMAERLRPDVVVLDQRLPGGTGLECGRWLREHRPEMALVMFSAFLDLAAEEEAARLGITTISKVDNKALFSTLAAIREELDAGRRVG